MPTPQTRAEDAAPPNEPDLARVTHDPRGAGAVALVRRMRARAAARGESVRVWLLRAIRAELERLEQEPPDDRPPGEHRPLADRLTGEGG